MQIDDAEPSEEDQQEFVDKDSELSNPSGEDHSR